MSIRKSLFAASTVALLVFLGAAGPVSDSKGFVDRFDKLRQDRWLIADGWRNGDYMVNDWRASQVKINNGVTLTLGRTGRGSGDYSSGEVQSHQVFGYGYYEVKLRAAPGSGVVTGFFTYTGPPHGKPWNEIDVEIIGRKPREVMVTYVHGKDRLSVHVPLAFDATKEAHVYGFDWQPKSIRWYLDGKLIAQQLGEKVPIPNERQKIMVDLWSSRTLTDWLGPFPEQAPTVSATISCISYLPKRPAQSPCM